MVEIVAGVSCIRIFSISPPGSEVDGRGAGDDLFAARRPRTRSAGSVAAGLRGIALPPGLTSRRQPTSTVGAKGKGPIRERVIGLDRGRVPEADERPGSPAPRRPQAVPVAIEERSPWFAKAGTLGGGRAGGGRTPSAPVLR